MSEDVLATTEEITESSTPLLSNQVEDPVQSCDRASQVQIVMQVVKFGAIHLRTISLRISLSLNFTHFVIR